MSGKQERSLKDIQAAIASGSLTREEIERRINAVVEHEINRKDRCADMELVNACLDLLCEIRTHGQFHMESHLEKNKLAVMERYHQRMRRRRRAVRVLKIAGAAAGISALALVVEILSRREFFIDGVTVDDQQYYVQGVVEESETLKNAQANTAGRTDSLVTVNLEEAIEFLGFTPSIPTWIPEGWEIKKCGVRHQLWYSRLFIDYINPMSGKSFSFEARFFEDFEEAYTSFEQSISGMNRYEDNQEIYYMKNEGDFSYVWHTHNTVYTLYKASDDISPLKIIHSVISKGE